MRRGELFLHNICMPKNIKRWIFPAAQGTTQVSYPYVFKASGQ